MLKTTGLIAGHYQCRSLAETLPVFTDLLAMEVVERKPDEATLKHPNTDWRLIVHEGGPDAPEKTFDNHYGFRVASHEEVEAAWKYIQAQKEKYRLTKITKPQSAHFAYSVYFNEPGGNTLEIEYYNPGGALHGRSHTAGHWESTLGNDRFPGRGYVPQAFTHGTLQCDDVERSRRFYVEVLGLEIAAGFNTAQYIKHPSTPWYIVVLQRSPRQYLAPVNRFTLQMATAAQVDKAHREFAAHGKEIGIADLGKLDSAHGKANFIFSDLDKNWWELTSGARNHS
jgi:catechol 2,3-dioxygenase-like lactoylglutathione lyase family enzyme